VKSQGACGSCYTFAAIGNVESKLLIDNAGTYDFSENHAKECNWRELTGYEDPPGTPWGSCDGGNYYMLASLFSREGLMLETGDPYDDRDMGCSCSSGCAYDKTLLDWRIISANAIADTNVLKQYILDNGPVYTMMDVEASQGFDNTYDGSYTFDYTMPGLTADHCVLIVGWSNNLPPVPGGTGPADGWIVKNSWGPSWGDNGYLYATYGAANLGLYASYMHDWQDYDPNEDVWSYDEDGFTDRYGYGDTTAWGLARFTPDANTEIVRVEFWTTDVTTDVDVYLYDSFNGSTLSNLRAQVLNRSFGEAGYHSVQLSSPVPVNQGDDIFAVIRITNADDGFPIAVDSNGPFETGTTYLSHYGTSWSDLGTAHGVDAAIRLRTRIREQGVLDQSAYLPLVARRYLPIPDYCIPDPPGESDNVDDALTVCGGQTVSGQVSRSDLDDVYKILAVANQQLTISMNGSGGDADLYLYPPDTSDVNTDTPSASSRNWGNNESIQGTVLVGGFWYIDVYSYEGTTNYNVTVTLSGPVATGPKAFGPTGTKQLHDRHQGKLQTEDQSFRDNRR
jgi:C1A family cysteine protease